MTHWWGVASYVFTHTLHYGQNVKQDHFFKQSTAGLNSEFSFFKTGCLTKAEESSLKSNFPYHYTQIIIRFKIHS